LVSELRHILPALLKVLPPTPRPLRPEVAAIPHARKSIVRKTSKHIEPRIFLETLRSLIARDTPLICDSGNHLLWSIQEFPVFAPRCFLCPADYQAMGFGLPAAIGAALNRPKTPTVAIIGDGGLLMSAGELATLARLQIPLCVIVWNDGALGLIRSAQEQGSQYRCASSLQNPDFNALASAHGFTGLKISTPDEIRPVLQKALSTPGPVLVDVLMRYPGPTRMARAIALTQWRRQPWPVRLRWARQWIKNRFILPPEL
jgi:acetolactate synthase-1/2/3 large subunit